MLSFCQISTRAAFCAGTDSWHSDTCLGGYRKYERQDLTPPVRRSILKLVRGVTNRRCNISMRGEFH
jgi:hypothetical protein